MELRKMLEGIPKGILRAIQKSVEEANSNVVVTEPELVKSALEHTRQGDVFTVVKLSESGELTFRMPVIVFKTLMKWKTGTWRAQPGVFQHDFNIVILGEEHYQILEDLDEAKLMVSDAKAEGYKGDISLYEVRAGTPRKLSTETPL